MYMTKAGTALKEDYQWQIKGQYHGEPLSERLRIDCTLFFGTRRTLDIDNFNKLILDAGTGLLWDDDSQIDELHLYKSYDKAQPRVELVITPIK